jgi:hypothetical protein
MKKHKEITNPNILMHRTVGLGLFCAKSNSRTKSVNPDTLARKRSAAGDKGVIFQKPQE